MTAGATSTASSSGGSRVPPHVAEHPPVIQAKDLLVAQGMCPEQMKVLVTSFGMKTLTKCYPNQDTWTLFTSMWGQQTPRKADNPVDKRFAIRALGSVLQDMAFSHVILVDCRCRN